MPLYKTNRCALLVTCNSIIFERLIKNRINPPTVLFSVNLVPPENPMPMPSTLKHPAARSSDKQNPKPIRSAVSHTSPPTNEPQSGHRKDQHHHITLDAPPPSTTERLEFRQNRHKMRKSDPSAIRPENWVAFKNGFCGEQSPACSKMRAENTYRKHPHPHHTHLCVREAGEVGGIWGRPPVCGHHVVCDDDVHGIGPRVF